MTRARRALALAATLLALTAALSPALARADESPELDRVQKALAQARADLDLETARAETARAEAARLVSAATARRDAGLARLEADRRERRDLAAREVALRAELEPRASAVEAAESELAATHDDLRRLETLAAEARAAERPAFSAGEVAIAGLGKARGRVLRWGPGVWFLGDAGLAAVRPLAAGGDSEVFHACPGVDLAPAFAAIERGEPGARLPLLVSARPDRETGLAHLGTLLRQGGVTLVPLALLSVLSVFTALERVLSRRRTLRRVRDALARGAATGLDPRSRAQDARARLLVELRRRLWILGTVASSAPFVGLLGTVLGIVRAFEDMAASGSAGFAVVAAGIAEALVTTAAGLVVALVAVVAYNALQAAATTAAEALAAEVERGPS